jgi:hypothetical protein
MNQDLKAPSLSRRQVLRTGAVLGIAALGGARLGAPARAAGRTL